MTIIHSTIFPDVSGPWKYGFQTSEGMALGSDKFHDAAFSQEIQAFRDEENQNEGKIVSSEEEKNEEGKARKKLSQKPCRCQIQRI